MSAEIFAEWLRRQGHKVLQTQSSFWFDAGPLAYQAFPYHWLIQPSEEELNRLLVENRAISLRYSTPVDAPLGRISYHAVFDAPQYSLELLDRRTRQNVRAGMAHCRVEQIPLERLAEEGWLLEVDTASRQGRHATMSREAWRRRYLAAVDLPGFEAWGALVDDRLAASILAFLAGDTCELISQQCHGDFINARVNHALVFSVTQMMMNRPGVSSVFYTLQSLDAPSSVDEFKFRMGYVARQVRQRVVFHPWVSPLVGPMFHATVTKLARARPGSKILPKLEGMLGFYLEGKRPLNDQDWPECIRQHDTAVGAKN